MLPSELARQNWGRRRSKISAHPTSLPRATPPALSIEQAELPPLEFTPRRRLVGLDVMRGLAIFAVVCGHLQFRIHDSPWGQGFWLHARQVALVGVDVFLVLSGFLIGGMLLSELRDTGRVAFGRFFARRAWRLLPVFVVTTLLGWYWSRHFKWEDEGTFIKGSPLSHLWPYATFTVNYYNLIKHDFGAAATLQAWTLCVIVHFYIILAIIVAGIAAVGRRIGVRRAVRVVPWLVAATFAMALASRWHNAPAATYKYDPYSNYFETHLRIDECMFGVLLAYWAVFCRPAFERVIRVLAWPLIAIAVGMYGFMMFRSGEAPRWLVIWGYTSAGVVSGGLIAVLWWWEQRSRQGLAKAAPAALAVVARPVLVAIGWVGIWSYAIYLSHQPLVEKTLSIKGESLIARHLLSWKSPYLFTASMIAYVGMAIAFGALLYFIVELPGRMLRDRWLAPRRAKSDSRAAGMESPFVTASAAAPTAP